MQLIVFRVYVKLQTAVRSFALMTKIIIPMRIHMREIVLLMEALQRSKRFKERWMTSSHTHTHTRIPALSFSFPFLPIHIYLKIWLFIPKPIKQVSVQCHKDNLRLLFWERGLLMQLFGSCCPLEVSGHYWGIFSGIHSPQVACHLGVV